MSTPNPEEFKIKLDIDDIVELIPSPFEYGASEELTNILEKLPNINEFQIVMKQLYVVAIQLAFEKSKATEYIISEDKINSLTTMKVELQKIEDKILQLKKELNMISMEVVETKKAYQDSMPGQQAAALRKYKLALKKEKIFLEEFDSYEQNYHKLNNIYEQTHQEIVHCLQQGKKCLETSTKLETELKDLKDHFKRLIMIRKEDKELLKPLKSSIENSKIDNPKNIKDIVDEKKVKSEFRKILEATVFEQLPNRARTKKLKT